MSLWQFLSGIVLLGVIRWAVRVGIVIALFYWLLHVTQTIKSFGL